MGGAEGEGMKLTEVFVGDFSARVSETPPGMAYLVGSGPSDKNCGDCGHMCRRRDISSRSWFCGKYKAMTGYWGKSLLKRTKSCKYFISISG